MLKSRQWTCTSTRKGYVYTNVTDFVSLLYTKQILIYSFSEEQKDVFRKCRSRIKQFATWKHHKFCPANTKSYRQRKTFWEIFATFDFFIALLVVQSKGRSILAAAGDQVTLHVLTTQENKDTFATKWRQDTRFLLVCIFFFQVL